MNNENFIISKSMSIGCWMLEYKYQNDFLKREFKMPASTYKL